MGDEIGQASNRDWVAATREMKVSAFSPSDVGESGSDSTEAIQSRPDLDGAAVPVEEDRDDD